jgi:hypothetical protein
MLVPICHLASGVVSCQGGLLYAIVNPKSKGIDKKNANKEQTFTFKMKK